MTQVSANEASAWARQNGYLYAECSAKSGKNVQEVGSCVGELRNDDGKASEPVLPTTMLTRDVFCPPLLHVGVHDTHHQSSGQVGVNVTVATATIGRHSNRLVVGVPRATRTSDTHERHAVHVFPAIWLEFFFFESS